MSSALSANLVHQNLAAAAGYRIQSGGAKLAQHAFNTEPGDLGQMIKLGRREAVQMNPISRLQFMKQPGVIIEWQIGMKTTLHQNSATAELDHFFDLAEDLFITVYIAFGRAGFAIKRTEG